MKIAISLPDGLFAELEKAVEAADTSRSAFVASAIEEKLRRLLDDHITAQVNAAIADVGQPDANFSNEAARRLIEGGHWMW
jgi:metal-responsive CopG/Arc/MetJ family transcriptional regulator